MGLTPMRWDGDALFMLDQRGLPHAESWMRLTTWEEVELAIRDMAVRGAPAIGIAAGYGMALAALSGAPRDVAHRGLAASRPTAVNLFWALDRMSKVTDWEFDAILAEAKEIEQEDLECNQAIGRNGAEFVGPGAHILTICNTGSVATAGHGTALGIIRTAHEEGKNILVSTCETRPRLQGLKLTAWELMKDGIPFRSIADSAAATVMRDQGVDLVVVGADRIAANGDTANKIGTYMLAVVSKHHGIPFVVAAPSSTLDPQLPTGAGIPIEERSPTEVTEIEGVQIAPEGCPVFNPAFDVTPGDLITAIVTETGVFRPPFAFSG